MPTCFWDHDAMEGVTEDCAAPEPGVFTHITMWGTRFGGAYDAHEASFRSVTYPDVSPPAGPSGDVVVIGYFEVDPADHIPPDVYSASVSPGSAAPDGEVELSEPLPAAVAVPETAFEWDAGNNRWTLTVPATFIDDLADFGTGGLFVVDVNGTEHAAWLKFGGIG